MNKEYIYLNGKCVIEDENGERRLEEYTDKTDEILVTENVIETLENDLEETRNDIIKRKKLVKSDRNVTIFSAVCFSLIPPLIQLLLVFLVGPGASAILAQTNSFILPFLKVFILSVTAFFGGLFTYSSYRSYRKNKKRVSGLISEKKAIEKTLERKKEYLLDLQIEKNKQWLKVNILKRKLMILKLLEILEVILIYIMIVDIIKRNMVSIYKMEN